MELGAFSVSLAVKDLQARNAQPLAALTDIRELQRRLKADGIQFATEADENGTGPASFMVLDPDGNPILADQHV